MFQLYHHHPPKSKDKSLCNQVEPTDISYDELIDLINAPKYTKKQIFIQIIFFLIFGITKIFFAIAFSLIFAPIFAISCSIWRHTGKTKEFKYLLQRLWCIISRIFLFIIGFYRVNFIGDVDQDARFFVGNHTCFFDGWFLLCFYPRPLSKIELSKMPILSDVCEIFDGISVNGSKHTGVTQELIENANDPSKPKILIFPEGVSTSGDYMLRFHLGAFLTDLPVQPCVFKYKIWGASRSWAHISFFHNSIYHILAFLSIPGITLDIHLLPSMDIKSDGQNDPTKFADSVALRIANEVGVRYFSLSSSKLYKNE